MSKILSGATANSLVDLINRARINVGSNMEIRARDTSGTWLRRTVQAPPDDGGGGGGVEGDFDFDIDPAYSESDYDIILDIPFACIITRLRIDDVGEDVSIALLWGPQGGTATPVTFTSGEIGGPFPTAMPDLPGEGAGDLFCSQAIPTLGYLQLNTGDFSDPGVLFTDIRGSIHYITT